MSNFNFDLGLGSTRSGSLNDQKKNSASSGNSSYSYASSATTTTAATQSRPSWHPNKPLWAHQTGLNGPTSMVGDISGKSWNSTGFGSGIGIVQSDPSLFGDLVNSAIGKGNNKSNSNVPLKNASSTAVKSAYSMGHLANSSPKSVNSATSANLGGSNGGFGDYTVGYNATTSNIHAGVSKSLNPGGPSMKSMSGGGIQGGMSGNRDPFGSLVDFGARQKSGRVPNLESKDSNANAANDAFGEFHNAAANSSAASPSGGFDANNVDFVGSGPGSISDFDGFGVPSKAFDCQMQNQPASVHSSAVDPLDMFFASSSRGAATSSAGMGGNSDFGFGDGHDASGVTTELEGLPPPPAGITSSTAMNKGMDNQKQGQYADAIKWLSWAVVLLEKTGDIASTAEVLSCRASCYKEVGEYKKAVADCSKVLEQDNANVSVLIQRALLYESMEKYKLGAEDLRTVLKLDPSNRVARSTIHRLTKMAD